MSEPAKKPQLQASVIPILYKRGFIEKHKIDITDFTKEFCSANSKQGKTITRRDVEWYWEGNVRSEFDTLDTIHNPLISQTQCPKFYIYWMVKTETAALLAKRRLQEQEGFWLLGLNKREKKHFKNPIILGNDRERWIVPEVFLMAIEDVSFENFVQNVRAANTDDVGNNLDGSKVFRLWGALIKKAYDFVPKEVQTEKLKEAFSRHPPTTEAGLEEFFAGPSNKRKLEPSSEDDTSNKAQLGSTQKRRRVSIGDVHTQIFDDETILDPTLKTILKHPYKPSLGATEGSSASVPTRSSTRLNSGQGREIPVDLTEKKVLTLEKELAKLKLAKDEVEHQLERERGMRQVAEIATDEAEHRFRSERGMRRAAERKVESLQDDLQESQNLLGQLQKRSTEDV